MEPSLPAAELLTSFRSVVGTADIRYQVIVFVCGERLHGRFTTVWARSIPWILAKVVGIWKWRKSVHILPMVAEFSLWAWGWRTPRSAIICRWTNVRCLSVQPSSTVRAPGLCRYIRNPRLPWHTAGQWETETVDRCLFFCQEVLHRNIWRAWSIVIRILDIVRGLDAS